MMRGKATDVVWKNNIYLDEYRAYGFIDGYPERAMLREGEYDESKPDLPVPDLHDLIIKNLKGHILFIESLKEQGWVPTSFGYKDFGKAGSLLTLESSRLYKGNLEHLVYYLDCPSNYKLYNKPKLENVVGPIYDLNKYQEQIDKENQ